MPRLFGTDGMRGVANQEPMTPETVVRLGRAVAHRFKAPGDRRCIVIDSKVPLTAFMERELNARVLTAFEREGIKLGHGAAAPAVVIE